MSFTVDCRPAQRSTTMSCFPRPGWGGGGGGLVAGVLPFADPLPFADHLPDRRCSLEYEEDKGSCNARK